jgi:hypothetical protein
MINTNGNLVYLKINGINFRWDTTKIKNVLFRPSFLFIKYPYIMEVSHYCKWTETIYTPNLIPSLIYPLTYTIDHDTKTDKIEIEHNEVVIKLADIWTTYKIPIINELNWLKINKKD